MFFVFSALGLSILYFSQIYLKLTGFKKNFTLLDYAAENGIKQGFDKLSQLLTQSQFPIILSQEETFELLSDVKNNGICIVEKLLAAQVPLSQSGIWEKMQWTSKTYFSAVDVTEKDRYFKTTYQTEIMSQGSLKNFNPVKKSTLEALIEIQAGYIPLPTIPLLAGKNLTQEQKSELLDKNNITIHSDSSHKVSPEPFFANKGSIPNEAVSQVQKALKIDLFYPQNLSGARLREALGLDPSNEPVPDGVYLIQDDLGLGGVFVQGDLEEMVLAVEQDSQVISFRQDQDLWILKFSPSTGITHFSTPEGTTTYNLIPLGIIIIEGKIHSLGGGIMSESGEPSMMKEEKIPSILQGVNLTIISSDEITLSSHIIHQGVKWQEGVPFLKDSTSQLNIFATGNSITSDETGKGAIRIGGDSPSDINIQASLTAGGEGFFVGGEDKKVNLSGSLHTNAISSNKSSLDIRIDERHLYQEELLQNAPATAHPTLSFTSLTITEWIQNQENIKSSSRK